MMFEFAEEIERLADIKVAGVGGAGGNAVGRMIEAGLTGVEFLAINTDLQALKESPAHNAMQIGAQLTKGLGSGGKPATGQAAAEEDRETLAAALQGADMVFVTGGMGGGTGTGAAPVIAEIARSQGALTVGIVTKPFGFEGAVRMRQAEEGIARLREAVDTLIVIPNQRLLEVVPASTSMQEAFRIADNVLYEATRGIYEIISRHDHVNLDFADVRSVMTGMGEAMMGTGRAEGEHRAADAARAAISSPLLENIDIAGSQAVLVNVLGREVGLQDTAEAMQFIQDAAGPQAHVIFGYGQEESLGETLQVTVIATGFQAAAAGRHAAARLAAVATTPEPAVEAALPEPTPVADEAEPVIAIEAAEIEEDPGFDALPPAEPEWLAETAPTPESAPPPVDPVAAEECLECAATDERPAAAAAWLEDTPDAPGDDDAGGFLVRPQDPAEATERHAAAQLEAEAETPPPRSQPFLTPVGRRHIGEVEVPENAAGPAAFNRGTAAGLRPDLPGDDMNAPAYTRKYMD